MKYLNTHICTWYMCLPTYDMRYQYYAIMI